MNKNKTQQEYIKSKFKNSECPDKCQFSQKWIELIKIQEKSKTIKRQMIVALADILFMYRFALQQRRE